MLLPSKGRWYSFAAITGCCSPPRGFERLMPSRFRTIIMQFDGAILQTIPEHICDAFLSWTLCTYYADPVIVSGIVLVVAAVGFVVFIRRKRHAKKDLG